MNVKSLSRVVVFLATLALPGASYAQECGKIFDGLAPTSSNDRTENQIQINTHADERGGFVASLTAPDGQALGQVRITPDGDVVRELRDGVTVDNLSVERAKVMTEPPPSCDKNVKAQLFGIRIKITVTICVRFLWWNRCSTYTFYI
jgi:hypothetical protein